MYTKKQLADVIDHAVLKAQATDQDVIDGCKMCDARGVKCIVVRPTDVPLAAETLQDSGTLLAVVIGFPHGDSRSEVKALETKLAIEAGAVEIDMVMNVGKFLSGDFEFVKKDIEAVVAEAKPHDAPVKVIQETCFLTLEQVARACKICEEAGADYVKTSTGFGDGPATPEVIDVMVKTVGPTMGVKASGGIRDYPTACGYMDQGCRRLGVGSTVAVLDGAPE